MVFRLCKRHRGHPRCADTALKADIMRLSQLSNLCEHPPAVCLKADMKTQAACCYGCTLHHT